MSFFDDQEDRRFGITRAEMRAAGKAAKPASRGRKMTAIDPMGQRRANANRCLRATMYQCPVAKYLASAKNDPIARRLVEADFDPHRLLARIEPYGDNPPFPAWRLTLLRMIHNAPWATAEELPER